MQDTPLLMLLNPPCKLSCFQEDTDVVPLPVIGINLMEFVGFLPIAMSLKTSPTSSRAVLPLEVWDTEYRLLTFTQNYIRALSIKLKMLIEHYFNPEYSEFPSFLLDCSHYPSVISLGQELGKSDILSHLHHLSRTWVFALHRERHKLLTFPDRLYPPHNSPNCVWKRHVEIIYCFTLDILTPRMHIWAAYIMQSFFTRAVIFS